MHALLCQRMLGDGKHDPGAVTGEGSNRRSMPRVGEFGPSSIARLLLGLVIIVDAGGRHWFPALSIAQSLNVNRTTHSLRHPRQVMVSRLQSSSRARKLSMFVGALTSHYDPTRS